MNSSYYRGFNSAQLDSQYNPRAVCPHFQLVADRWNADSIVALQKYKNAKIDLAYGRSESEKLDVFPSHKGSQAPIQVFFHGGYWRAMDKSSSRFIANMFAPAGATTIIANYALCPTVTMEELLRQTRACIAWIWKNASELGGNPDRIYVSGHSAGAHIACMLLATDWTNFEVPDDVIKGVCAISGLYDLEPVQRVFVNQDLRMTPEQALKLSPLLHQPARPVELLMSVGSLESEEWRRQSSDYVAAWRSRNWPIDYMVVPGHDHYSIMTAFADPKHPLGSAVLRQMHLS